MSKFNYRRGNKYNAQKTVCMAKHEHPSKLEAKCCSDLFLLRKSGKIKDYEIQKRFDLVVNDVKICAIVADFYVTENNLRNYVVEAKGYETAVFRLKLKLFKAIHPAVDYRIIK